MSVLVPLTEFGPFDVLAELAHQPYVDGDPEGTVAACDATLPLVRAAGDRTTELFCVYSRSIGLRELGRYDEVIAQAEQMLELAGEEALWRAKALALLAEASAALGRTVHALDHLAEGLELVERTPRATYNRMSASMALAVALGAVSVYEAADELIEGLFRRGGASYGAYALEEGCALRAAWGASEELVDHSAEARGHYVVCAERAQAMRRSAVTAGDRSTAARADVYVALALQRLGDDDGAWALLGVPGVVEALGTSTPERLVALVVRGRILLARGELARARADLLAAEALGRHSRRHVWLWTAVEALAECDVAELGDHPAARRWRDHARGLRRRLHRDAVGRAVELAGRRRIRQLLDEQQGVHRAASTDPLTGLANRRALLRVMDQASASLGAVFVDVDHFKDVNDRFSHEVGDRVLVRLAGLLMAACRASELVVRYGGDEFLVVVEDDPVVAQVIAERVHAAVRAEPWGQIAEGLDVTVSVGVEPWGAIGTVLASADRALYAAKRGGRDRVVSGPGGVSGAGAGGLRARGSAGDLEPLVETVPVVPRDGAPGGRERLEPVHRAGDGPGRSPGPPLSPPPGMMPG